MKVFCLTVRISLHILPICLLRDLQINTACFTEIKTSEDFLRIQKIKVIFCSTFVSLWTSLQIPNNRHEMKCWGKWVLNVKFRIWTTFTCCCIQSWLTHSLSGFNTEFCVHRYSELTCNCKRAMRYSYANYDVAFELQLWVWGTFLI